MQNRTFKSLVTWLIIASPIWWTSGCYSTREITRLEEAATGDLKVVTKGNNRYAFERWSVDSLGGISGDGTWEIISEWGRPVSKQGFRTLPHDSISETYHDDTSIILTTRGNTVYHFTRWLSDNSGGIWGEAFWENPTDKWNVGKVRVPADSIKRITASEYDRASTTWLTVRAVAAGAIAGWFIYAITHFSLAINIGSVR